MTKFGGPGKKKKACLLRRCMNIGKLAILYACVSSTYLHTYIQNISEKFHYVVMYIDCVDEQDHQMIKETANTAEVLPKVCTFTHIAMYIWLTFMVCIYLDPKHCYCRFL